MAPNLPISDQFVLALPAEADAGDLAVSAALPLVTVAASLGELELTYPSAVAAGPAPPAEQVRSKPGAA